MTISTARKLVACPALVLSVSLATVPVAPADARASKKPIVRDHRSPTWTPKTKDTKDPPVVRDHRDPWQPRPHPKHYRYPPG